MGQRAFLSPGLDHEEPPFKRRRGFAGKFVLWWIGASNGNKCSQADSSRYIMETELAKTKSRAVNFRSGQQPCRLAGSGDFPN